MTRRWPFPRIAFSRVRGDVSVRRRNAENDAFRFTILPHLDAAWSYARYLTRDADVAEDVVQDAFLRAVRSHATCRGDGKAWLMAIVRNCWHDWLREHRPRDGAIDESAEPVEAETPHTVLERSSDANHVRALLEALPEPFRETLVLRELEELPYRDIAQVTGVPIGTVMSRLSRGREMLATLVLGAADEESKGAQSA